jgi:hypothetical protein
MLRNFLYSQDIDILLQEVVTDLFDPIPGYSTISNVGSEQRGTAIFVRDICQLTQIENWEMNGRYLADISTFSYLKSMLPQDTMLEVTVNAFLTMNSYT